MKNMWNIHFQSIMSQNKFRLLIFDIIILAITTRRQTNLPSRKEFREFVRIVCWCFIVSISSMSSCVYLEAKILIYHQPHFFALNTSTKIRIL